MPVGSPGGWASAVVAEIVFLLLARSVSDATPEDARPLYREVSGLHRDHEDCGSGGAGWDAVCTPWFVDGPTASSMRWRPPRSECR